MSRLAWDQTGERLYENGVDRGVVYPSGRGAVAWNGLVSVREQPEKQTSNPGYFEGRKYSGQALGDSFQGTIEAFTYPDELDGDIFGFSYRNVVFSDLGEVGHRIHLVYNPLIEPSDREYSTTTLATEPSTFSWDFSTTPMTFPGFRPTAHLVIDTTKTHSWTLSAVEDLLYGSVESEAYLPTPQELLEVFETGAILRITDNGDGTWTADGPDEAIRMLSASEFEIEWPSAVYIDAKTYTISSL